MQHLARGLLTTVFVAGLATGAAAQTKWDMPTPYGDGTFHTKNVRAFAEDVKKATGGKLDITVHSAGSLVKPPEITASVFAFSGRVQQTCSGPSGFSARAKAAC